MTSQTLDISEARRQFNRLDEILRAENIIKITRHGKEAFAVVDLEYLTAVIETVEIMSDPESHQLYLDSLEDIKNGRLTDHEDLKKEILGE
ncbi:MAG: type II toxin-antitoxin system Phd/YefM family antitoxin [Planctomycetota bacterium]